MKIVKSERAEGWQSFNYSLVADLKEKLCKLVPEFGSVYERRKLRVTLGINKVMRLLTSVGASGIIVNLKCGLLMEI